MRLPSRFAPLLFGGLLSGLMSLIVSGVATLRTVGLPIDFLAQWLRAWTSSWPVAFAAVLVVAPAVRRLVAMLVESPATAAGQSPRNGA
ncbi:MAG: DUF2798 domain-containing protein [Hyphomicrobiaceae bacterium]